MKFLRFIIDPNLNSFVVARVFTSDFITIETRLHVKTHAMAKTWLRVKTHATAQELKAHNSQLLAINNHNPNPIHFSIH